MAGLKIQMLGEFQVWREGCLISQREWRGRKTKQLLKILLTERRLVLKDQLIELLWGHLRPASAERNLQVTVCSLRRVLEPESPKPVRSRYILSRDEGYTINLDGVWLDVDEFLKQVEEGKMRRAQMDLPGAIAAYLAAEHLYQGDYLQEDLYEDWAQATREELVEIYFDLQNALADCYCKQADHRQALACFQKVLRKDPFREEAYRGLMRCYYHLGEQIGALRAFERCKKLLEEQLEVRPMPQTQEVYEQILKRAIQIP